MNHQLSDLSVESITQALSATRFGHPTLYYATVSSTNNIATSAAVEGAGYFRTFWHITLPGMSPTLFFLLVTNTIGAFSLFTQVNIMTQGGPGKATQVLAYTIYREAFLNNRWGYACAQSLVFMAMLLAISLMQFKLEKKGVHYQ